MREGPNSRIKLTHAEEGKRNRPKGSRARGRDSSAIFPTTWPTAGWAAFQQDLLSTVYPESAQLWRRLRQACGELSVTIEHLLYEGDIEPQTPFGAVLSLQAAQSSRRSESDTEDLLAVLEQARSRIGIVKWEVLIKKHHGRL
jgi:hypothetical protein